MGLGKGRNRIWKIVFTTKDIFYILNTFLVLLAFKPHPSTLENASTLSTFFYELKCYGDCW